MTLLMADNPTATVAATDTGAAMTLTNEATDAAPITDTAAAAITLENLP